MYTFAECHAMASASSWPETVAGPAFKEVPVTTVPSSFFGHVPSRSRVVTRNLTGTLAVGRGEQRRVRVNEAVLLEELVDGVGGVLRTRKRR